MISPTVTVVTNCCSRLRAARRVTSVGEGRGFRGFVIVSVSKGYTGSLQGNRASRFLLAGPIRLLDIRRDLLKSLPLPNQRGQAVGCRSPAKPIKFLQFRQPDDCR